MCGALFELTTCLQVGESALRYCDSKTFGVESGEQPLLTAHLVLFDGDQVRFDAFPLDEPVVLLIVFKYVLARAPDLWHTETN